MVFIFSQKNEIHIFAFCIIDDEYLEMKTDKSYTNLQSVRK